jgi:hypothetical protein
MRWVLSTVLAASSLAAACSNWRAKVPPKYLDVAEIHHAHCGGCHRRVEPGQRTRAQLERALAKHHKRLRLTDTQWERLVDYLTETP